MMVSMDAAGTYGTCIVSSPMIRNQSNRY